jgi:hypothetical protein
MCHASARGFGARLGAFRFRASLALDRFGVSLGAGAAKARAMVRFWSTGSARTINPADRKQPSTESSNPMRPNIRISMADYSG